MPEQGHRIERLQHAVEAMAEQMLQLQAELAALRAEAEASNQRQLHLMARTDQIDAMQASLFAYEQQQQLIPRKRPGLRRLTVILLSMVLIGGGMSLAIRAVQFQREVIPASDEPVDRPVEAGIPSLLIIAQGPTWLEVEDTDGKSLYYGMAVPGRYRFPVEKALKIRAGRPDRVSVTFQGSTTVLGTIETTSWRVYKRERTA
jgi:hypothetical protein